MFEKLQEHEIELKRLAIEKNDNINKKTQDLKVTYVKDIKSKYGDIKISSDEDMILIFKKFLRYKKNFKILEVK